MSVLDKLRITPESDEQSGTEFGAEPDEEFDYESDRNLDPPPGAAPSAKSAGPVRRMAQVREAAPRITKKMQQDAQDEIQSIVEVLALGWGMQAPPCGEALEEAAPKFAEKLTKIVARNPRWLQRVRDGGVIADIIACAGTLQPVFRAAVAYYSQPKEADHGNGVVFDPAAFQPYDGTGFSRAG